MTRLLSLAKIAKVTFISKIVEKLVAVQLISYLDSNKLILSSQSGFHKGHSTETLLLRLLSEIYGHQQVATYPPRYDVSAAFDSLDHDLLLKHLFLSHLV